MTIVVEVGIVVCVGVLFSILNRLCAICCLIEDIKKLITNPNIVLPDEMVNHIAELLKSRRSKPKSSCS